MQAPDLVHARTMTYDLECNWKVFNDNYLVGWTSYLPVCHFGMAAMASLKTSGCATAKLRLVQHVCLARTAGSIASLQCVGQPRSCTRIMPPTQAWTA